MSREAQLRRHVRGLEVLEQAVFAMKSLSAHHFRQARAALIYARTYRESLEAAVAAAPLPASPPAAGNPLLLVVGADLGLCAHYHSRLVEVASAESREIGAHTVDCIGRRTAALLARAGTSPRKVYAAPSSVENATRVLLEVAGDLFAEFASARVARIDAASARFGGVGEFRVARTRLLPLHRLEGAGPPPSRYVTTDHLAEITMRERLFILLYELLLDSMASEHGVRLVATNSAGDWLDGELEGARRRLRSLRRDAATQEILELSVRRS
jgi:F-type H+-transporting ATPase subunit gamma